MRSRRRGLVFAPRSQTVYPNGPAIDVRRSGRALSTSSKGRSRPGHFRGVATVVLKLFEIVRPDVACFGQKDYQQQLVIRRMVEDLHLAVEIDTCPTIREADGLAMSSRNRYLNPEERKAAVVLLSGTRKCPAWPSLPARRDAEPGSTDSSRNDRIRTAGQARLCRSRQRGNTGATGRSGRRQSCRGTGGRPDRDHPPDRQHAAGRRSDAGSAVGTCQARQ